MSDKVFFDGINKLIIVQQGITEIDFQRDIFSGWKDWFLEDTNSRFLMALITTGGTDSVTIPNGEKGISYFLDHGWKIRPFEGNHRLIVNGNVFTTDGSDPFVETLGNYKVTITMMLSNIIGTAVGDVTAVELDGIGGDEWTVTLA